MCGMISGVFGDVAMSGSPKIKGRITEEVLLQVQRFLWDRGASIVVDFGFFNFKDFYMHKNL